MKKICTVLLFAAAAVACKKQTVKQCGEVVSSRPCVVCAQPGQWVVDVYFKETGATTGFVSAMPYQAKQTFCIEK